jgi:hypothetical protein
MSMILEPRVASRPLAGDRSVLANLVVMQDVNQERLGWFRRRSSRLGFTLWR